MIRDDIIEESFSPWRSQVVVGKGKGKLRLCIDYLQSGNRYTGLDALPLPRIDGMINDLLKYHYFSKLDLRTASHLIPLHQQDMKINAFEANGSVFYFKRIPFGLTNADGLFNAT